MIASHTKKDCERRRKMVEVTWLVFRATMGVDRIGRGLFNGIEKQQQGMKINYRKDA